MGQIASGQRGTDLRDRVRGNPDPFRPAEHPSITFVVADAEKFPESRSLAKVDNLPTFATFKAGAFVNQVQTNKFDVLKTLVDEVASH